MKEPVSTRSWHLLEKHTSQVRISRNGQPSVTHIRKLMAVSFEDMRRFRSWEAFQAVHEIKMCTDVVLLVCHRVFLR